jgi:RecA/RadA recombinase
MLRAKKPEAVTKRLKLFMYGPAGIGKTTAAMQFPKSYIIDAEKGTENYDKLTTASESVVFQTSDVHEVIAEIKSLLTEKHEYRTLVIDPITTVYNDLLEKSEAKVGSDFGRHYGEANKHMKRLANLIMALDMNVIISAHAKTEYGDNLKKLGFTFDGWKQLDYWFDLVLELGRKGGAKKGPRIAKVVKTRLEQFPDEDVFEWTYENFSSRYGAAVLEREASIAALANPEQVKELKNLLEVVRLPDGTTEKWLSKAGVDVWEDMPREVMEKCIDYVKGRLPNAISAA